MEEEEGLTKRSRPGKGGRRSGAGRPRSVKISQRFCVTFNEELRGKWKELKQRGGFTSDSHFVSHLLGMEESRQRQLAP